MPRKDKETRASPSGRETGVINRNVEIVDSIGKAQASADFFLSALAAMGSENPS
jgi:hypothetical protein